MCLKSDQTEVSRAWVRIMQSLYRKVVCSSQPLLPSCCLKCDTSWSSGSHVGLWRCSQRMAEHKDRKGLVPRTAKPALDCSTAHFFYRQKEISFLHVKQLLFWAMKSKSRLQPIVYTLPTVASSSKIIVYYYLATIFLRTLFSAPKNTGRIKLKLTQVRWQKGERNKRLFRKQ